MKKSKRGFTLVELLAVIALIGVIMLIVAPNVIRLFKKGTKSAFKNEVLTIYNSVYPTYLSRTSDGDYSTRFCVGNDNSLNPLDVENKDNLYYDIVVNEDGSIIAFKVISEDYVFTKNNLKKNDIKTSNIQDKTTSDIIECGKTFTIPKSLKDKILEDNPTINERTDFTTPFTKTTTGTLFTSTESIAGSTPVDVYYYAGNTTNNWVLFGGFYWRIIRTNHDKSIRLLYVGTSHDTTEGYIGISEFNTNSDSPKYVGYKYGEDDSTLDGIRTNTTDSTIKTYIDTWYQNNLTNYTKYLSASAVYCNDRSEETEGSYSTSTSFKFIPNKRLYTDITPTYNCSDIKDAFSVENTSAKLDYPIALMTADEVAFAGGTAPYASMSTPYAWFVSNSAGIKLSSYWWTLSPYNWNEYAFEWRWRSGNTYGDCANNLGNAVRPVISLKSCAKVTGVGTPDNPYVVDEKNSSC